MPAIHVVTGAGPVGSTIARRLADAGERVLLLTRSGSGPEHALIERRRVDVSRSDQLAAAFRGAVAVHHCIHASRYDARTWRAELPIAERHVLEAAGRVGAVVVFPAASDFYGPLVRTSHAGERLVPTVLAGRTMRVVGSLDQPHSFTYVPDLAAAMVAAAGRPDLWNSVLHAPTAAPVTQRRLIDLVAAAGGVEVPRMSAIPAWVLGAVGLVSRDTRELAETAYMFTGPFVLDSRLSEQRLGLSPTPFDEGIAQTVAWWQGQVVAPR